MEDLIEVAKSMLAKMEEGKNINPYEYKAWLRDAIDKAEEFYLGVIST